MDAGAHNRPPPVQYPHFPVLPTRPAEGAMTHIYELAPRPEPENAG